VTEYNLLSIKCKEGKREMWLVVTDMTFIVVKQEAMYSFESFQTGPARPC